MLHSLPIVFLSEFLPYVELQRVCVDKKMSTEPQTTSVRLSVCLINGRGACFGFFALRSCLQHACWVFGKWTDCSQGLSTTTTTTTVRLWGWKCDTETRSAAGGVQSLLLQIQTQIPVLVVPSAHSSEHSTQNHNGSHGRCHLNRMNSSEDDK